MTIIKTSKKLVKYDCLEVIYMSRLTPSLSFTVVQYTIYG